MASQAQAARDMVGEILELPVGDIDPALPSRIGLFFPEKAEALAALIGAHGQNDPIKVRHAGSRAAQPWTLVAGLHRLEACRQLGQPVQAIAVEGSEDALLAIQASENLDRRTLSALERSMFVAAVADAAKRQAFELHGVDNDKALAAKAKAAGDKMSAAERLEKVMFSPVQKADVEAELASFALRTISYSWNEKVAEVCEMTDRHLRRSLRIYRVIVEPNHDLMDAFKAHPVASNGNALLAICQKDKAPALVRAVIEWLIAHPAETTADAAIDVVCGKAKAPKSDDQKRLSAFTSAFQRMTPREKKGALAFLAEHLPAGWSLVEGALPDNAVQLQAALDHSFIIIARLAQGEGVDDEELEAARRVGQAALLASRGCVIDERGAQ